MTQDNRPPGPDLDLMLGSLGNPEGAAPVTSPAEILARAATLTPLVVGGLHGWKLAATLGIAIGGGFLAGLLARGLPEPAAPETAGLAPAPSVRAPVASPPSVAAPEPTAPSVAAPEPAVPLASASRPSSAYKPAPRATHQDGEPAPPPSPSLELPLGTSCPAPAADNANPTLSDDDLAHIDAMLPERAPAPPEEEQPAQTDDVARREEVARKEEDVPEDLAEVRPAGDHRMAGQIGAGALLGPGAVSGLIAGGGVRRGPSASQASGGLLGADLDLGLLTDGLGSRWSAGAALSAGRTWRLGGVDLDASWTAGGRLVLPSKAEPNSNPGDGGQGAEPPPGARGAITRNERALLPMTGPKLGLSLGDRDHSRLHLDLAASVSPGDTILGLQPWFSVSVGSLFPLGEKKSS